jgi:hypothetical protein
MGPCHGAGTVSLDRNRRSPSASGSCYANPSRETIIAHTLPRTLYPAKVYLLERSCDEHIQRSGARGRSAVCAHRGTTVQGHEPAEQAARLVGRGRHGHGEDDAEAYAKTVVLSDLEEAGDEDVFRKVRADLDKAKTGTSDAEIREQMAVLLPEARSQVIDK